MNEQEARSLSKAHTFTKLDLYQILKDALNSISPEFWKKPNVVNPIFDNGSYFNSCRDWVGLVKGVNEGENCSQMVVFRVLHVFGEFSKIQPPNKIKRNKQPVIKSEIPTL
jgi:hypothetical protein